MSPRFAKLPLEEAFERKEIRLISISNLLEEDENEEPLYLLKLSTRGKNSWVSTKTNGRILLIFILFFGGEEASRGH